MERSNNFKDMTGQRFGRLIATRLVATKPKTLWSFQCDCGETVIRTPWRIERKMRDRASCGQCVNYHTEPKKHGMSYTITYQSWAAMVQRCTNKRSKDWPGYGGRGIKVCAQWLVFENFLEDMGERPPGTKIERDNNEDGYVPGNCKWADSVEQANNRRSSRFISAFGRTATVSQFARVFGVKTGTLWARLKAGVPVEEALTRANRKTGGVLGVRRD